jgi:hypothetical protein
MVVIRTGDTPMKMKTLLAALAVSSLALAQPAAAATRSSDSLPKNGVQASISTDRVGAITEETDSIRRGTPILLIILLFGSVAALVALLTGHKSAG